MRHYTGKHGILESFLREIIANGLTLPENPKHAKRRAAKAGQRAARQARRQQQQAVKQQQKLLQKAEAAEQAGKNVEAKKLREEAERHAETAAAAAAVAANPTAAISNNNNNELLPSTEIEAVQGAGGAHGEEKGKKILHQPKRLKRSCRNSTGSVSSPDSLMSDQEDHLGNVAAAAHSAGGEGGGGDGQRQQLALVVKRSRPDGESEYALVDLKYLSTTSTTPALPQQVILSQPMSIYGSGFIDPTHFSALAEAGVEASLVKAGEEEQVILQQPNREQLIQQQLAMQRPVPVTTHQLNDVPASSGQQLHDLQPMPISLPQQPLPPHQLGNGGAGENGDCPAQTAETVQYQVADDQQQHQMVPTFYLTPSGEAIQLQPATILSGLPANGEHIQFVQSTMADGNCCCCT
jgi:hypothetical protein